MEQHDAALGAWQAARATQRTLVHIDAHHDMWWVDEPDDVTIANFIAPALATGIVREVHWVVPDPAWEARSGRAAISRVLRRIAKGYPEAGPVRAASHGLTVSVLGRTVTACPLEHLPRIDDDVLLDIDVDYLLIPRISTARRDRHSPIPWCWPDQLAVRLASAGLRSDLVTIAYSVDGGYTPLRWKYLGDELRARLANPAASTAGWDLMKRGAIAAHNGDSAAADAAFADAESKLSGSAAPAMARALLAAASNHGDARRVYRDAIARDRSYRTPYVGDGFPALWDGDLTAAEKAFRAVLTLDDTDPFAALGMGLVALARNEWTAATNWLGKAVKDPACEVDARRGLARVHRAEGRLAEAVTEFERSLVLTLKGQTPIARPILTHLPATRLPDPDHALVHAWLAECHAALGDLARAINGYRIAIVGGQNGSLMHARLAWWLVRNGEWAAAITTSLKALAARFGWRPGYAERSAKIASRAAASMENRRG